MSNTQLIRAQKNVTTHKSTVENLKRQINRIANEIFEKDIEAGLSGKQCMNITSMTINGLIQSEKSNKEMLQLLKGRLKDHNKDLENLQIEINNLKPVHNSVSKVIRNERELDRQMIDLIDQKLEEYKDNTIFYCLKNNTGILATVPE